MAPNQETIQTLKAIECEIVCGKVLFPKSDAERAWNDACDRASAIITNYRDGVGLFQQITRKEGGT
jgi:hypothetical protein